MRRAVGAGLCLLLPSLALAQTHSTPYAGQEARAIKALSAAEIEAYGAGEGMGLARAAELNHYPGPKHVLELAAELGLADEQRAEASRIYDRMHAEAVRLGAAIVENERALDRHFAGQSAEPIRVREAVEAGARLQGELRAAHLGAHLEIRRVLTAEQVEEYERRRGYRHDRREHSL